MFSSIGFAFFFFLFRSELSIITYWSLSLISKSFGLSLFFKFFSPSKELVYIKHWPKLLDSTRIKSAANIVSSVMNNTSPTSTFDDGISLVDPLSSILVTLTLFISENIRTKIYLPLSALYLCKSSTPSLITETKITNKNGRAVDRGLNGLIWGKAVNIELIRK